MKYTLLDMTQQILGTMSSDDINSISDNSEATQVARTIRSCYYDIIAPEHYPESFTLFNLDASTDPAKPVLMTRPANVNSVMWIRYNKATIDDTDPKWTELTYRPIRDFLDMTHRFSLSDTTVDSMTHVINGSTVQFLFRNDISPRYYTSFDDSTIIFDAYDSEVESTLESIRTEGYGHVGETFQLADSFVPHLDDNLFPLLLNAAKAECWEELLRVRHPGAEKKVKQHKISAQRTKAAFGNNTDAFNALPNYGRR